MLSKENLQRLNALAKKSKVETLTPEEKEEQTKLRGEYLVKFREHFRGHLDRIKFVEDEDVEKHGEKN